MVEKNNKYHSRPESVSPETGPVRPECISYWLVCVADGIIQASIEEVEYYQKRLNYHVRCAASRREGKKNPPIT